MKYAPVLAAAGFALGVGVTYGAATPLAAGAIGTLCALGFGGMGLYAERQARRAAGAEAEAARLRTVLDMAPLAWCRWDEADADGASAGAATLLPPTATGQPDAFQEALRSSGAAVFTAALDRLRTHGEPFDVEVSTDTGRRLAIGGRRGAGPAGGPAGGPVQHVLWLRDVSGIHDAAVADHAARAQAEGALSDLRAAFDALPFPLWLRRDDLSLAWCNVAYARAVDAAPERAIADQRELSPGDGGRALAQRARSGGFAQSAVCPMVIGSDRRVLDLTEAPLPTEGGTLMIGYALDITPLESLRAELKRHEAANAEVLERLGTAIAIFGPDQRITFFNQAYIRLWELDEAFLRGEPTHSELMEELRTRRKLPEYADFQTFKRERLTRYAHLIEPIEEMMHLPDGTTLRVLAAPHPMGGTITILEDVTNTLALESSYNTLIAVQQETLDNLAEGIAVFGGDGRLKLSNPAFARIWDLHDEDLQGEPHIAETFEKMRPFLELGGDWASMKEEMIGATLERAVRSGRLERVDGSVVEFSTVPLPDGAVLNSYLDVTDSARLEQALRASNAALEAADELKSEFIANVSHHLRTPLNGIIGFAEVLANQYFGALTPRQLEYVKGVLTAGERLLELIDDVVDLTSIGAGVQTLDRGPVDVGELLDSVATLTREWARREGLRLEVTAAPALGVLDGDEKRLKQALFNLVVSAIRQPPPGGRIVLGAHRHEDSVELSIGDGTASPPGEGYGNARFDRADARSNVALSLSLVKNVIELHGGRMEFDDAPGQGLRVRCVLPAQSRAAA